MFLDQEPSKMSASEISNGFPKHGLQPKIETGVGEFLKKNPTYDGRDIVIAILDTGVDPLAPGLQKCPDGSVKVVDIVDCSGSGDVLLGDEFESSDDSTLLPSLRMLRLNPKWTNPSGKYRTGSIHLYDIYPEDLLTRVKDKRKEAFMKQHDLILASVQAEFDSWLQKNPSLKNEEQIREKEDFEAKIFSLNELAKLYEDVGMRVNFITFFDGSRYRAAFDLDGSGDLTNATLLTDYKYENQCLFFSHEDMLAFGVNFYNNGTVLSIVTDCGSHGTHVASIAAAYFPDDSDKNGIAIGAKIVSIKIGDSRLGSMETGIALARATKVIKEWKCDLVNMSYGEHTVLYDEGFFVAQMDELVKNHGVIFVSSAGNGGPALSTLGAPGGTSTYCIGVGAYVTQSMMQAEYALMDTNRDMPFTWSSLGPARDGHQGVCIYAPGAAITSVPNWVLSPNQRMNGTSMSSPNACGCIALVLSGLKQENVTYSFERVKNALFNSAKPIECIPSGGLIQVPQLFDNLKTNSAVSMLDFHYKISVEGQNSRGIYVRRDISKMKREQFQVNVSVEFPRDMDNNIKVKFEAHLGLISSESWIKFPEFLHLNSTGGRFSVNIDYESLEEGCNFGFIRAIDGNQSSNELFSVPITVIKPALIGSDGKFSRDLRLKNNKGERFFLQCPRNSTAAHLSIVNVTSSSNLKPSAICLHCVQLDELKSSLSQRFFPKLLPGEKSCYSFNVISDEVIEIFLGHFWTTSGMTELELKLTFDGIVSVNRGFSIAIPEADNHSIVKFSPLFLGIPYKPSVEFNGVKRTLNPKSLGKISALDERSRLTHSGVQLYQCLLNYSFKLDECESEIVPLFDFVRNSAYDLPVVGYAIQIYDVESKCRVYFGDSQQKPTKKLPIGNYEIAIQIIHYDLKTIEIFKNQPIVILIKNIFKDKQPSIEFYDSLPKLFRSEDKREKLIASKEKIISTVMNISSNGIENYQNGDVLLFSLTFMKSIDGKSVGTPFIITKSLPALPPKEPEVVLEGQEEPAGSILLNELLSTLKKLPKDCQERNELISFMDTKFSDELKWYQFKLHSLDKDSRNEIVLQCDKIIQMTDFNEIIVSEATKSQSQTDSLLQKRHKEQIKQNKDILMEALYKKILSLQFINCYLTGDQEELAWEDYEKTYNMLSQLVDISDSRTFIACYLWREMHFNRFGNALKAIINIFKKRSTKEEPEFARTKADLLFTQSSCLHALGWEKPWGELVGNWTVYNFPESYSSF